MVDTLTNFDPPTVIQDYCVCCLCSMRPSNVLRFKEKLDLNPEGLVTGSAKLDANRILSDFGI